MTDTPSGLLLATLAGLGTGRCLLSRETMP